MIAPALIALALVAFLLWQAYAAGHSAGFWQGCDAEAGRWKPRVEELRRERTVERANGDALIARHARQQRRLRGILGEARRWKAVAVRLGWRRPSAGLPVPDDTVAMIAADDVRRGDTLAIGRDGRVYHWSTVVYGARSAPQSPPDPVHPSTVILPPQESAEAAERLAADVRRILGAVFERLEFA